MDEKRIDLTLLRIEQELSGISARLKRVELLCAPVEERVAHVVDEVTQSCQPEVERIRWTIGKDLTNTEALKLRVVVEKPADVWGKAKLAVHGIEEGLRSFNVRLLLYTIYRTVTEQDVLQDKDWE